MMWWRMLALVKFALSSEITPTRFIVLPVYYVLRETCASARARRSKFTIRKAFATTERGDNVLEAEEVRARNERSLERTEAVRLFRTMPLFSLSYFVF